MHLASAGAFLGAKASQRAGTRDRSGGTPPILHPHPTHHDRDQLRTHQTNKTLPFATNVTLLHGPRGVEPIAGRRKRRG